MAQVSENGGPGSGRDCGKGSWALRDPHSDCQSGGNRAKVRLGGESPAGWERIRACILGGGLLGGRVYPMLDRGSGPPLISCPAHCPFAASRSVSWSPRASPASVPLWRSAQDHWKSSK
jgi:hypothetical protein